MRENLSEAKPGDTLFVSTRWDKYLVMVDRVTPTGRVITKNGTQFNPDGYQRGSHGFDSAWARIATADDIAGINRRALIRRLEKFTWSKLTAEQLKTVEEIVGSVKP